MGSLEAMPGTELPVIDFSAFHSEDPKLRTHFIETLNQACRNQGFFQLKNTNISLNLQEQILETAKSFFALPMEEKMRYDMNLSKHGRGYGTFRAQRLEPGTAPDTNESIYIGEHLPPDHPRVLAGEYMCGPNLWPDSTIFQDACTEYFVAALELVQDLMKALALGLKLRDDHFDAFCYDRPSAILRMVHYPPTPQDSPLERGSGAHRDFGCVTVLLQDQVGGLQVQDETTGEWIDVVPVPGAFVVNIGNTMMRWSNHHFTSSTHRVMNFSRQDRYSVPFFFNGNVDTLIDTIPGCEERSQTSDRPYGPPMKQSQYQPIVLKDFLEQQFQTSYVAKD